MILDDYWTFIFGLQYNANLFFKDKIDYYRIPHEWSSLFCDGIFVRDFENNNLLYDSIDGLVVGLYQQNFKSCSLYPFELLFDEMDFNQHPHLNVQIYNYPVAVFKNTSAQSFALVQINEKLKSEEIKPIGDPREFWGVTSSQINKNIKILTLIPLNDLQKAKARAFDHHLNWISYFHQIKTDFLESRFNYIDDSNLRMSNNLFIKYHGKKYLIEHEKLPNNLAFPLLQRCIAINESLSALNANYHERPHYPDFIDSQREQYVEYLEAFKTETINLICHTANNFKNSRVKAKFLPIQKNTFIASDFEQEPSMEELIEDSIEIETPLEDDSIPPISTLRAMTTLLILFIIVFLIVYGLIWVIRHYEIAKATAITVGVVFFLYVWSKK